MPASPAAYRLPRTALARIGTTAAAAAAIFGLSATLSANAAVVSSPAASTVAGLGATSGTGLPVLDGRSPAQYLSGQALPGKSPLDPAPAPPRPARAAAVSPVIQVGSAAKPAHAAALQAAAPHASTHRASKARTRAHASARARPARPYLIYDSVTPTAIPPNKTVATYATGPYAVQAGQVAGRHHVLWIDVNGSDSRASALDVEPGDATPTSAAGWAWRKLHVNHNATAIIYTMRSEWPATQAAVGRLPSWMQSHVRWWIADPTGYAHVVHGSSATQWYWGSKFDISTALPGF